MVLNEAEGVQYELFDPRELDQVAIMAAEAFSRHESIASALGMSSEVFADFVRLLGPKLAQEELTVIARRQRPHQIIGTLIADDFAIEPPEEIRRLFGNFEIALAVLNELDAQYKQGRILAKGDYVHFFLLAVDHRQTGKKIASHLVRTCLENAIRKGYKTGVVEATGVVSQHIFRTFGFMERFEIPYKTFTFQGNRVFASIKDHHGIMLMDKALAG